MKEISKMYSLVYEKSDVGERWTVETAKKLISYWFKRQPDVAYLAECNGQIVGAFIAGIKPWWDGNHISDGELFVHPNYQKKGIATKLSIAVYEKALEKYGVVILDAYTFKRKKFPLSWYLSQGFTQNKEWTMITGSVKTALSKLKG